MATYSSTAPYVAAEYLCDSCKQPIPFHRPRLHCLNCVDYDSCSDCHVMQSFAGSHCLEHKYDVYVRGQKLCLRESVASAPSSGGLPAPAAAADPDAVRQRQMAEELLEEKLRMAREMANAEAMLEAAYFKQKIMADVYRNITGGWRTDQYGNRWYDEGLI